MEHHKKSHSKHHSEHHKGHHSKEGHHAASHRDSSVHGFEDHNPYVLKSMHAHMVASQNRKFAATRVKGSRDDYSVPSQMHGETRNVQHGA